jgi:ferredoxin
MPQLYCNQGAMMPTITPIPGTPFEVETGKRLILALEDSGLDVLHRCGGYAKCTTCRVHIAVGEPDTMTTAERDRLAQDGLVGEVRLACQIECQHDMTVEPVWRLSTTEFIDAGNRPQDHITPDPVWVRAPR